jgi:hypothetical protein
MTKEEGASMKDLTNLSDEDLRAATDTAYLDTLSAATTEKDSKWHRKTMLWRTIEHYRLADSTEEHIEQKEVLDNYIDDILDNMEGFPAPTQREQWAADALRRQHQIILTLEAAQAGIKTVTRNIRVTEPVTADKLLAITTAYEQGVGYGRQRYKAPNPYALWSDENGAWELGYQEGIDMEATTPQPDQGARAL